MKPNFESEVHTARDLVERNITLYYSPNGQMWKQWFLQSDILEYRKIGENMIITKNYDQYDEMTKNEMLSQGTHARVGGFMRLDELDWGTEYDHDQGKYKYNFGRGYYRGGKVDGLIPGGGHLTNKKWHLNEVDIQNSHLYTESIN